MIYHINRYEIYVDGYVFNGEWRIKGAFGVSNYSLYMPYSIGSQLELFRVSEPSNRYDINGNITGHPMDDIYHTLPSGTLTYLWKVYIR